MIDFGKKCKKHQTIRRIFLVNSTTFDDPYKAISCEMFNVNFATTTAYQNSAIPTIQRRLNQQFSNSPQEL